MEQLEQVKEQLELVKEQLEQKKINLFWNTKILWIKPKFNGVYSVNNLSKMKDGAYIINLDEYESIKTHWIALYVNGNNVTYFDSFGVEHIPKMIKKFTWNENFITNIYIVQSYDSILCV